MLVLTRDYVGQYSFVTMLASFRTVLTSDYIVLVLTSDYIRTVGPEYFQAFALVHGFGWPVIHTVQVTRGTLLTLSIHGTSTRSLKQNTHSKVFSINSQFQVQ